MSWDKGQPMKISLVILTLFLGSFVGLIGGAVWGFGLEIKSLPWIIVAYITVVTCTATASFVGSLALSRWAMNKPAVRRYLGY